ncbi:MAG: ATP-binding cassette domain-containing protein [Pseudomonadota bacterium]|nr:ATP-binding cassette domain-containing protein [Pseudomonadota bacterium]
MSTLFKADSVHSKGMKNAISLQLQSQQMVVLFGESGTGKSVLFKALADLVDHQGTIQLNGQSQMSTCPENWRQQVMYFSAETAWWRETAEEHFETLPTEDELQQIGLSLKHLTQPINALSSGEKQRLALLRGLVYKPTILLLDEITANLDKVSTLKVESLVKAYCQTQSAAMIWISHDEAQTKRLAEPENRWNIDDLYRKTEVFSV